jgi:hypothetical protein
MRAAAFDLKGVKLIDKLNISVPRLDIREWYWDGDSK